MADSETRTVSVVKDEQEHWFRFDGDDPLELFQALMRATAKEESGFNREEAFEVITGLIPERLRSI